MIKIRTTKRLGRGLYAARNLKRGEVVEISPVIVLERSEHNKISDTLVNLYVFGWQHGAALALGLGSLFNHSKRNNVTYMANLRQKELVFMTTRPVKKGHQLFIDYGYDPKHGIEVTKKNKELCQVGKPSDDACKAYESKAPEGITK